MILLHKLNALSMIQSIENEATIALVYLELRLKNIKIDIRKRIIPFKC